MLIRFIIVLMLFIVAANTPLPKFDSDAASDKIFSVNLVIIDEVLTRYYMNHGGTLPKDIKDKNMLPELQNINLSKVSYTPTSKNTYVLGFTDKFGTIHISPNSNKALPPYSIP